MKDSAPALQAKLNEAYEKLHETRVFTEKQAGEMSPPLLLQVSDHWAASQRRLLVIGQETKGWEWLPDENPGWPHPPLATFADFLALQNACTVLVEGHRTFEFSLHQPANYNGYTWRAYRQMRAALGEEVDGFETGALLTNLFRMDLGGESVLSAEAEHLSNLADISAALLLQEIEILKPTDVVFLTGPNYEPWLTKAFHGVELVPFKGYDPGRTAQLKHPKLPQRTWRTYHPGYLSRGNWQIMNDICEALASPTDKGMIR